MGACPRCGAIIGRSTVGLLRRIGDYRMGRNDRARQRAIEHLHGAIRTAAATEGGRLPCIAALARDAGVSTGAMWRAVQDFKARGELRAAPRAGLTIGDRAIGAGGRRRSGAGPEPCHSWEHARNRLQADITGGRFVFGSTLPPSKVLMERYGVGFRTLRKALQALVDERLLDRRRRSYHVSSFRGRRSGNEVRLVLRSDDPASVRFHSQRDADLFRELETRASSLGLGLRLDTFGYTGQRIAAPNGSRRLRLSGAERQRLLGVIVWSQGLEGLGLTDFVSDIAAYGTPVAVLDTSGAVDWSPVVRSSDVAKVFGLGISAQAGRDAARYLWHLGHRRIAVITATYFQPRIDGIVSFYERGGEEVAVAIHAPVKRLFDPPPVAGPDSVALQRALRQMIDRGTDPSDPVHRLLAGSLRIHAELVQRAVADQARQASLLPLLERALAAPGVSAWVLGNDDEASLALEFLRGRGVAVPRDISVMGFDDTALASSNDLTSYNFNVAGLVHAVYTHIVHPSLRRRRMSERVPAESDGFVTGRGSTGPVQRPGPSPGFHQG